MTRFPGFIMCERKFYSIDGFGEELNELIYEGSSNWFVSFRPATDVFRAHFSYLIIHLSIIACGILTLKHAKANGSGFVQFWCGAMVHGLLSENVFGSPRRWHAQAVIMLFGKRLPLHMVFFYPTVLYLSFMGVRKFNLAPCSESAAAGMLAMIMKIPFRMVSVRFLHITYHDSDPIYSPKFYGVPWFELFCDLVFAVSYIACYCLLKCNFHPADYVNWKIFSYKRREGMMTVASGMVSPLLAFVQKVLFFHVLHDIFNINVQTCLLFLTAVYMSVVMCRERKTTESCVRWRESHEEMEQEAEDENEEDEEEGEENEIEGHRTKLDGKKFLYYALCIYIASLLYLGLLGTPENEVSIGTHELTGDCTTLICTKTLLGKTLKRRKYLCVDEVQERHNFAYNFDCLPDGPPSLNAVWYTICGTPIRNRAQFLTNIISFIILIMSMFLRDFADKENGNVRWKATFLKFFCAGRRKSRGTIRTDSITEQREANETVGEATPEH